MMIDVNPINDCGECVFNNDFVYCNLANECTNYRNGVFDLSFCPLLYPEKIKSEQAHGIVRCKDCKISKLEKVFKNVPTSTETVRWCELINRYVDDDWFCADGQRET